VKNLSFLKNKLAVLAMFLVCWAITASFVAGYYWLQYTDVIDRIGGAAISVNIGIKIGNNSEIVWHNDTKAISGMTLFRITKNLANVTYSSASGFGVYITAIDNVASNDTYGWVWWKWDSSAHNWKFVSISSDAYAVADGEAMLWYYESAMSWPPTSPS
jgi:hypothetical protein